ncbi:hypothetical protein PGT21_001942 [Puccinia graminis f. sp. tritici]|uniref:Staphylococcal nuclease domain-containing protein 1 n=1 Tax=Puccinia graminis f. sp. tritici TaxID=56615 RepID=A0A5B0QVF2_PUCGR|nr:hypothetical protein PGT21_001942 [Puccinia graminis f. sp. tritici]
MAGVRSPRSRQYSPQNQADSSTSANEGEPFATQFDISSSSSAVTSRQQLYWNCQAPSWIGFLALLLANGLGALLWDGMQDSFVRPEHQGWWDGTVKKSRKLKARQRDEAIEIGSQLPQVTRQQPMDLLVPATRQDENSMGIVSRVRLTEASGSTSSGLPILSLADLPSDARELLRRRLIGKQVHVSIDYVRPKEGDYEAKECVTIKLPTGMYVLKCHCFPFTQILIQWGLIDVWISRNVANLLLERGYATVLRHRQGEDRSQDYDMLMATEMKAQTEGKGLHSDKEFPPPKITDVSESSSRANSYLSGWKRQGKIPAVVDYVASGSRFKIWLPKQDLKFTLVLSGIKCPKTARHPGERNEPFGLEALDFSNRYAMQRDVEVEIESTDKSGGLFLNKTDNLALLLVKEGLASCNEFSLERSPYGKDLKSAEDDAKQNHKNILKNGGIPELTSLMADFAVYHRSAPISSTPAGAYKAGDLVSAKFSVDNAWYRAKIRKNLPHKKEAEVVFIDYGNSEVVSHGNIRSLDPRFKSLPPQAKEATLSFVKLLGPDTEYGSEALDHFRSLVEGQTLVANIDYRDPSQNGRLHLSLYDTADSPTSTSSLNHRLVREGFALINLKAPYRSAYQEQYSALENAKQEAKRNRAGAYEFGDAFDD